jgi:hypothetical protein
VDFIYICIGMFVSTIFIVRRELLIEDESYRLILRVSVLLCVVGIVLHFIDMARYSASGVLLSALPSLVLFRLFRRLFIKWFKREPRDTFFNWEDILFEDRIFNLVYCLLTFALAMLLGIGMKALADAGW